jgi:hypothetical protein
MSISFYLVGARRDQPSTALGAKILGGEGWCRAFPTPARLTREACPERAFAPMEAITDAYDRNKD